MDIDWNILWQLPLVAGGIILVIFLFGWAMQWAHKADDRANAKRYRKWLADKLGKTPEDITEWDVKRERETYYWGNNIFPREKYMEHARASYILLEQMWEEKSK